MADRKTVMISSTIRDLPKHRGAVMDACLRQGMFPLMMEHLPASDAKAIEVSLQMVEQADIYLGIYAQRYGYVPEGHDISITEMEYNRATERGIPRLLFLMHDDHPVRASDVERGDGALKLDAFKKRVLKERVVSFFKSPADLRAQVIDSLSDYRVGDIPTRPAAYRFGRDYRNRQAMFGRVRHSWIKGVLEQSLYSVARIELGLEEKPEAIERPWAMIVQEQGQPARELPQGVRMSEVFDELGGALLILGAPGTGKTTMLLELASDLLNRATREPEHPIPIVFHLSSWAVRRRPLTEWMMDELNERYNVPKKVARAWVEKEAILPLLDGLDEVAEEHRAGCAQAINGYRQNHWLVPMAVCSRTEEYETLAVRLRLPGAVAIEPLTRGQVDAYLAGAGPEMSGVREALAGDATLYELLDTPLMLSVATLVYKGGAANALQAGRTVEERQGRLLAAYVKAMHERRGVEARYTRAQTDRWLAWLASEMSWHRQTTLLIERLQPSWISGGARRGIYVACSRMADGVVVGLLYGLIIGVGRLSIDLAMGRRARLIPGLMAGVVVWLLYGLIGGLGVAIVDAASFARQNRDIPMPTHWRSTVHVLAVGLAFGFLYGLTFGLDFALRAGVVWGLIAGLMNALGGGLTYMLLGAPVLGIRSGRQSLAHDIQPVEALKWRWPEAGRGSAWGAAAGLLGGFLVRQGLERLGIGAARGSWVDSIVCFALIGALFGGLKGRIIEIKTVPNYGIRQSAKNAAFAGLISALIGGLISALTVRWSFGWSGLLLSALFGVFFGGLLGASWYGGLDAINHIILRLVLYLGGCIPWSYARFLDYATERIFLRKVGGGYIFIHRLLQDHLAELWERECGSVVRRTTTRRLWG